MDKIFRLWEAKPPGALGEDLLRDIPFLTAYWPNAERRSGASIIVCPGGGYGGLMDYEGRDYALWLNDRGITAFVLNYRLATHGYRHPVITNDLVRAVRFVRAHALKWGLEPSRIGVIGSSAGGHLAAMSLVHFDAGLENAADPIERVSSRPDFGILCYAVLSMGSAIGHDGSKMNLLGPDPKPEDIDYLSAELQVKKETPPCFIFHTQADEIVKVDNALHFAAALVAQEVPVSLHIYPTGLHGVALGFKDYVTGDKRPLHPWTLELDGWLRNYGFISV